MIKKTIYVIVILIVVLFTILIIVSTEKIKTPYEQIWQVDTQNRIISEPIIKDNQVFIQTNAEVISFDLLTGEKVWATLADKISFQDRNSLNLSNDMLIISRGSNSIKALSIKNGETIWELNGKGEEFLDVEIYQSTIYEARYSSSITSYDVFSGYINWSSSIPSRTSVYIFPEEDNVYLGTNKSIILYDSTSGKIVNQYELNGLVSNMIKQGDVLYLGYIRNENCAFEAINIKTGTLIWCTEWKDAISISEINDIFIDGDRILASGDKVISLNRHSGEVVWISEAHDDFGLINVSNNEIYIQGKTDIYKFSRDNGSSEIILSYPNIYYINWMSYSNINPTVVDSFLLISDRNILSNYRLGN